MSIAEASIKAIDDLIRNRIKKLRQEHELTEEKASSLLKMDKEEYVKYESGTVNLSFGFILAIAKELNTPLNYFYQDMEAEISNLGDYRQRLSNEVAVKFAKLNSEIHQEAVHNLVRVLVEEQDK